MSRTRTAAETAELADEALVAFARSGDDRAVEILLDRFKPQVRSKARTYFLVGGDRQDVIQEGMIGLYKAVRDYDQAKHPSFRHFADMCVTRQVITAVNAATRHKHAPLNSYVSLHGSTGGDGDDHEPELADRITDVGQDPADRVASTSDLEQLKAFCLEVLSDLETEVLVRYVAGETYHAIAADLGRHTKAIDNAVQRIKRKLESYVDVHAAA
ncbi:RNA polymerase sporulation sigma factor SigH [soil metagenome]